MKLDYIKKSEIEFLTQAFLDLETGNHLLCRRSDSERKAMNELVSALNKEENRLDLSEREKEILFLHKVCTDYEYAVKNGLDKICVDDIKTKE